LLVARGGDAVILSGARVAFNAAIARRVDLEVREGRIHYGGVAGSNDLFDVSGMLLLPGLINAHDHLEFNLFPSLGRRLYNNASEWAADIYRPFESPVKEHLSVPLRARLMWGAVRNLMSGVTTVAHHNACDPALFEPGFPVSVLRNFAWAHSLEFSPDLTGRFQNTPAGWPFIVHAAEGIDDLARSEIARLEELGILAPHTVLVHAIAAGPEDLARLRRHATSIVWCPRSNFSTYGHTVSPLILRSGIRIALGTDSAISSTGDLRDDIRTAVSECGLAWETMYRMVTSGAASVLGLRRGEGSIREEGVADLVGVVDEGQSPAEAIANLRPEFVMVRGRIRLLSNQLANALPCSFSKGFQRIRLASHGSCYVDADLAGLYREATASVGSDLRLAGRSITVGAVS
jgi:cytosine/adenosine deaminase-related metal-dependent hydrolase